MFGTDVEAEVSLLEKKETQKWMKLEKQADGAFPYTLHCLPLAENKGVREYHLDVTANGKTIQLPFKMDVQVDDETITLYALPRFIEGRVSLSERRRDRQLNRPIQRDKQTNR